MIVAKTVADYVVQRLAEWGVRRVFGYPGDGANGMLGALHRAHQSVRFIQVRHEDVAAFMAYGHAKSTGQVGICLAASDRGVVHRINGLCDSDRDHQPVVAIIGETPRWAFGGCHQPDDGPERVRHLIDGAVRIAMLERRVTTVVIPGDLIEWRGRSSATAS